MYIPIQIPTLILALLSDNAALAPASDSAVTLVEAAVSAAIKPDVRINTGSDDWNVRDRPLSYKYRGKFGQDAWEFGFAQAVRVGSTVVTTGQGGWDPETGIVMHPKNQSAQIEQSFRNVELALFAAGAQWDEVYHLRTVHMPLSDEAMDTMRVMFAQYLTVRPAWTAVGVTELAIPGQLFEMDVEAYSPLPHPQH